MRAPILVGEICYTLQCALDYLVFELAKYDTGAPQKNTQFPVAKTPEYFRSERAKHLKGVSSPHVDMIERLQPYNEGCWTRVLRKISNRDKHREFVAVGSETTGWAYGPTDPEYAGIALPIHQVQHPTDGEMSVKVDLSWKVHFAPKGPPVIETLEEIKIKVLEALTEFKAEFK